jgi:GTP-binding protein
MTFSVNTSPYAGRCGGTKLTSRMIGDYLMKEAETNIALKVSRAESNESYEVSGRGELQLGILIEEMRRDGFELSVSRPRVILQNIDGKNCEPFEEVVIDVDEEFSGVVVEKMQKRKAELTEMKSSGSGRLRLTFIAPSRGLIGYLSEFRTDTRGTGIMNRVFHSYMEYKGVIESYRNGVLVSMEHGQSNTYALFYLQPRGTMFIEPGVDVYSGMIIGENSLSTDLEVNPVKGKQLTNVRASGSDEKLIMIPPRRMSLEDALSYIKDDEIVEVTPKVIRIRKKELDYGIRKKNLGKGRAAE